MHDFTKKYSCLVFGEGAKDTNFLKKLIDLKKFKYHTSNWVFGYGNGAGASPRNILQKCNLKCFGCSYDLVICFIDLDKLKHDFPNKWQEKRAELELEFKNIHIIWQIDKAEHEYIAVIGGSSKSKNLINRMAKVQINKFINSSLWNRILEPIKNKEKQLTN